MALILQNQTDTSKNITTELLLGSAHTASKTGIKNIRVLLSNLTNTAASITVRIEILSAADAVLGTGDITTKVKNAVTNTTFTPRLLSVFLRTGEKLKVYATSDNASDTSVNFDFDIIDAEYGSGLVVATSGADGKMLISTDAQDLSATLSVNAKKLNGSTPSNLSSSDVTTVINTMSNIPGNI